MKKKPIVFADFYKMMVEQKNAYETGSATMSRLDIIWRKSIAPFWKNIKPKEITPELVVEFMNWHKEKRRLKNGEPIQLTNVFKYLGNLMQVMVEAGALETSKKPKLELPKTEQLHHSKQKGRYISDDEFQRILSKSEGWFKVFLLIAYTTGMRKMEMGKMELSRMEKIDGRWILSLNTDNTKTGNARKIPLSKTLTDYVDEQIAGNKKYLFEFNGDHIKPQSIDMKWQKAKQQAKIIGRMREHDIRHTAASNMAKSGINPVMATTLLGMSLTMFQKTYLKLSADDLIIASESAISRLEKK